MFYFLIFHTSISASKDIDRKSLTTFLYGSVMYIILHAILSSCEQPFLQVIRRYFWIIVGLDIVSMFFVYKTILDTTETGSVLKDKLFNLLEGLADTSMYSANPVVNIDVGPEPQQVSSSSAGGGILKKNVRIDETSNKVFPIEPVPVKVAPPPVLPPKQAEPEINRELAQLAEEFNQVPSPAPNALPPPIDTKPVKPTQSVFPAPVETRKAKSAAQGPSINVDSEYSNRMKEYGGAGSQPPSVSPIASTSISEIQKKRIAANSTTDVLQNRDRLTNEDIEKINLNYDPNDVLKLYGYGNMSDLQAGQTSKPAQQSMSGDNDDLQSMISGASDIGSAFDIDLSEFENNL